MGTPNQPEDPENFEYYNQKLHDELKHLEVDLQNVKKLAADSLLAFIKDVAIGIGLTLEQFLELFGPLFHDGEYKEDENKEDENKEDRDE